MNAESQVRIPVSRSKALVRAIVWFVPAALLTVAAVGIYRRLNFVPSGISNRLVDYAFAIASLPIPVGALWTAWKGMGWLLLSAWGSAVEIIATPTALAFHLGPFARRTFQIADLDVRYPFQLMDEDDGGGFESFLPEEQQRATLLPRIIHPTTRTPLQRTILQFAVGQEAELATQLRGMIERWQAGRPLNSSERSLNPGLKRREGRVRGGLPRANPRSDGPFREREH